MSYVYSALIQYHDSYGRFANLTGAPTVTAFDLAGNAISSPSIANLATGVYKVEVTQNDLEDVLFRVVPHADDQAAFPDVAVMQDKVYHVADNISTSLAAVKAKTDLMDASSINIVSPISGAEITILRGDTFECSISGLGSLASYVSLDFTVKSDKSAADSAAIIRIRLNASGLSDGLLTLNGAAALNADDGAIVITDAVAGDITITLAASCTDDLATSTYVYDVQLIEADGEVSTLTSGNARVIADVTMAVS